MLESICIFTESGRTYTFKNVTILCDNETVLVFDYAAMSDGKKKVATFQKSKICGWSKLEFPHGGCQRDYTGCGSSLVGPRSDGPLFPTS